MDGSAYFAIASIAISIGVGVMMAIHPEWRTVGWVIIVACAAIFAGSTAIFVLGKFPQLSSGPSASRLVTGLAVSIGLLAGGLAWKTAEAAGDDTAQVPRSELQLHFYGDARFPAKLSADNIWRWYLLRVSNIAVVNGQLAQAESGPIIFINFDKPIFVGTMTVESPDSTLPAYDVKEFNRRFAIISFSGPLPSGTFIIKSQ
ncbi:MAG TPA: hypothetical protein VHY34_11895 [Caulobacteraceae bacterium]|jgi:hypothetical protein|nr:hypothetical protein [Caulobacteraceae bacterium]